MQPIFRVVPNGVEILLYADDILLIVRDRKMEALHRKLQAAVKAADNPNARRSPSRNITIDRVVVPYTNRLRTLGVTLDRTLNFKAHCKMVKEACASRLRVMKAIGAYLPRGKRELTGNTLPTVEQLPRRSNRVWHAPKPSIVWDVKKAVRAGDPPEKVRPIIQNILSSRFHQSSVLYTDGSKCENTVGAGLYRKGLGRMRSLPQHCSVFSAEAFAIRMALTVPNIKDLVILTDSASCLLAIETSKSKHPWIQEIENISRGRSVRFCWIPGHAGIQGNNEADRLANEARSQAVVDIPIPAEDALRAVRSSIRQHWDEQWFASRDPKLREVKFDTYRWKDRDNGADQRVLTRLRIGHTRLTHDFLLNKTPPPRCDCCGVIVDVRHVILRCRKYDDARRMHDTNSTSLGAALGNDADSEKKLLNFRKEANLYKQL
ncbi:uncharacterized protein LOC131680141 [Topomyia yanbarensis]|uniref:uncharacterized protein LOC131680141 n=1 Tax=Topomyia yanbarensis TaxID=2498891 RepID=UPI00273C2057|nr:uncharacterized protein LOC131680141 [Topomyia yanbarensis]